MKSRGKKDRKSTSWGSVADWYEDHLKDSGTYHETVIAPNLIRMLGALNGVRVIDIGCGEGFISRQIVAQGASVVGVDIAEELILRAREHGGATYYVASAEDLRMLAEPLFDVALCVLAIQNIKDIHAAFSEAARILAKEGKLYLVMNHPCFRIPKRSSWGFDEAGYVQYRRLDGYLSSTGSRIDMTPGIKRKDEKKYTMSFHRSLGVYIQALKEAGFVISHIEEWISDRKSQQGPRAKADDRARMEFPLFLAIEATKRDNSK